MSKNSNRLPEKTRSKGIQKEHLRRYDSGKVTKVNRGVTKKERRAPAKTPKKDIVRKRKMPLMKQPKKPLTKKPTAKTPWVKTFKIEKKKKLSVAEQIQKDMDRLGIQLQPGERVAQRILNVELNMPSGYIWDIEILNEKGQKESIPFIAIQTPNSKEMIDFLIKAQKRGTRVIYKEGTFDKEPVYLLRPDTLDSFGWMDGVKDIEYVRGFDTTTAKLSTDKPRTRDIRQVKLDNGDILVARVDKDENPLKWRQFKNKQHARDASMMSASMPVDIFGDLWRPQTKLESFKMGDTGNRSAAEIIDEWREKMNPDQGNEVLSMSKRIAHGKLNKNTFYELRKGPDLWNQSRTVFTLFVFQVNAYGYLNFDNESSEVFKSRAKAEEGIKMLRYKYSVVNLSL
jgi:hypothetical protein